MVRKVAYVIPLISPLAGSASAFALEPSIAKPIRETILRSSPSSPRRSSSFPVKRTCQNSLILRGGGPSQQSPSQNDVEVEHEQRRRRRGMSIALASTYLTVMGAKCALPSVLSLLISPDRGLVFPLSNGTTAQGQMAKLLGLSTLAVALGKLLLGPLIDSVGGIRAIQISLSSLAALLLMIASSQQFGLFAVCWILVDFIFSSCWAACINAIHQSFPEPEWGKQIGILAAGARIGNTLSFAIFASLLYRLGNDVRQPWRHVFGVAGVLQAIPLSLLAWYGTKTLKDQGNVPEESESKTTIPLLKSLGVLRKEASTPEFWLHLLSRSSLMVFVSFLLFVPTLMSQVYKVSDSLAAQVASVYSLGCLLSVTFGSSVFSNLKKKQQAIVSVILTGLATLSSVLQLGHVSGIWELSTSACVFSLFLWGFACSIPFYIPPSMYALARGGKESSATIADVFDVGGFTLLAIFNGYVGSIDHSLATAWTKTFVITTVFSIASLLSLPLAILRQ